MGSSDILFSDVGGTPREAAENLGSRGALLVRSGPSAGRSFPVGDEDLVVGRSPGEGGVQLDDPGVSHRHALVRSTPSGCMIYDMGSFNGTTVDDAPLAGSLLHDGDVIKLGEAELQFVDKDPS